VRTTINALGMCLLLTGCAIQPYKKPLPDAARTSFYDAGVYARADENGVGVQYFAQDSSAAGAGYGLVGALVTATIDAVANATPLSVAQNAADKVHGAMTASDLQTELELDLAQQVAQTPDFGKVTVKVLPKEPKARRALAQPLITMELSYALATDMRSLQVTVLTEAYAKGVKGADKNTGLAYRNRFEYHSDVLPKPAGPTPERIEARAAEVKEKYKSKGKLSQQQTIQMKRELVRAREVSPQELADEVVQQWVQNDYALLNAELRKGTSVVLDLWKRDFMDATMVDPNKQQPFKSVLDDHGNRVVARYNMGTFAGALTSEPKNFLAPGWNQVVFGRADTKAKSNSQAQNFGR
jgi:hypothetical protein